MPRIFKRLLHFFFNLYARTLSFLKNVRIIAKYHEIVSVCEPNTPVQKLHTEDTQYGATRCQIQSPEQPGARNLCTTVLKNSITSLAGKYSNEVEQNSVPITALGRLRVGLSQ
jgi:hypothetical protein